MKGVVIRQGGIPAFYEIPVRIWSTIARSLPPMAPESPERPAWLNWLFLLAFLWSSYQLAGLWFQRLHS